MKKIFISHSSKDISVTEKLCNVLESQNVQCWYSERDLDKSTNYWQDVLMSSINTCKAVLLLITKNSVASEQVYNEITNASSQGKLIIPYFTDNISLPQKYEYYLTKYEWITAYNMSDDAALSILFKKLSIAKSENQAKITNVPINDILKNENICFDGILNGGYGMGYDKCIISNGSCGWSPEQIYIEDIDHNEFSFSSEGDLELEAKYAQFCQSAEYKKMEARGNNRTRWMVSDLYQNENLYISLKKTKWSQTTFWWNQIRDNPEMQKKMALHTFSEQLPFYPNSLCLHLIIETADNLLIATKVSRNKKNDYAYTVAVTIGEQINSSDFSSGTTNNNFFIYDWCKRALIEELGFTNENYNIFTDESSIRVLGVTYEGDIYNFALPTYVKLNLTYDALIAYMSTCARSTDEYTEILKFEKEEILNVLQNASSKEVEERFHPSSFLRFLLYLSYKDPKPLEV